MAIAWSARRLSLHREKPEKALAVRLRLLRGAVYFGLMSYAWMYLRSTPAGHAVVSLVVIEPARVMAEWLGATAVWADGASLRTTRARVVVTAGCEGSEWCLLSVAAVLAWPARWSGRITGLLLLPVSMLIANDLRIAWLLRVIEVTPAYFEWLHAIVLPTAMGLYAALAFSWWACSQRGATSRFDRSDDRLGSAAC